MTQRMFGLLLADSYSSTMFRVVEYNDESFIKLFSMFYTILYISTFHNLINIA